MLFRSNLYIKNLFFYIFFFNVQNKYNIKNDDVLSDPYAVLTTIDLQFMTCTQSITRIGETHPTSNHQPPNASSVKVELYYENDDSIIPLPPFLASYSSSKTRTTYDTLPSLVSITRMEHCIYCCSDFYWMISLLMCCMEL